MSPSTRVRTPLAHQHPGDSLAAPATVGQGACTRQNNRTAWLQIAAALDKHPHRELSAHARAVAAIGAAPGAAHAGVSAGAAPGAEPSMLPDGNHGETLSMGQA